MKKISLALLVSSILVTSTFAQDIASKDLQQLLNERNISAIQNIIMQEPDNGEAYYMASIYYGIGDDELGTNKDEAKKEEYLQKSADLGVSKAELDYGFLMLEKGNADVALQYMTRAAGKNDLKAIESLGDLYFTGYKREDGAEILPSDLAKSIEYLSKGISLGSKDAQYTLAHIYFEPSFGYHDEAKALSMFEKNIDYVNKTGHMRSIVSLIGIYESDSNSEKYEKKLIDLYYLASLQGLPQAFYKVGLLQRVGAEGDQLNIAKDPEAAFVNLEQAAKLGYVDAMFRIGEMYFKGEGAQQSDMNAYIWMAIAEDLSGNKTNYSETILELIPKRQRQITIDNKNHYRQFFTMPKAGSSANSASNIQVQ